MSIKHSLEELVNVTRHVFKTAFANEVSIELVENNLMLETVWSQVDIEKNERTKFQKNYLLKLDHEADGKTKTKLIYAASPQPIRNNLWNVKSPNKLYNAIITSWKENGEEIQFLEIWKHDRKIENINLTKLDKHANVYENSVYMGSLVWSSDSSKLAYIAEAKNVAKEKSFFTSKICKGGVSQVESSENEALSENNYDQKYHNHYLDDWGEQLVGKSKSVIAIYDLASNDVKVVNKIPDDYFPAQITWCENKGIVFNAYYVKPYKLGLIYTPIRKSELFYYDVEQETLEQFTDSKTHNVRDPRFSPSFEHLCWLQNIAKGPHFQCTRLMIMNWKTRKIDTLIECVDKSNDDNEFPGLYSHNFPQKLWSSDEKRIILNTGWRSTSKVISVDVETKQITNLGSNFEGAKALHALSVNNDWICAQVESYTEKPSLVLGKLNDRNSQGPLEWTRVDKEDEDKSLNHLADVQTIKFTPTVPSDKYPDLQFEAVFIKAKHSNGSLISFPHGGPHSAFGSEFSFHIAIFLKLGYSILLINYRGSSNFGQDSINSLPGHVGTVDVKDCHQAAEYVKTTYGFKHVLLYGGSHGGYLSTQLIGQYPDFYTAASVRNPVTHLETMYGLTDISDWVLCEGLGLYEFDHKLSIGYKNYETLYDKSPIKHVDNVKTPLLIMIGSKDLRVPPNQGIEYYKALLARNVPTNLIAYKDDNHPLDKPQTLADTVVHTVLWFEKYLN